MVSPVPTNNTRLCGPIKSSSRHRQGVIYHQALIDELGAGQHPRRQIADREDDGIGLDGGAAFQINPPALFFQGQSTDANTHADHPPVSAQGFNQRVEIQPIKLARDEIGRDHRRINPQMVQPVQKAPGIIGRRTHVARRHIQHMPMVAARIGRAVAGMAIRQHDTAPKTQAIQMVGHQCGAGSRPDTDDGLGSQQ